MCENMKYTIDEVFEEIKNLSEEEKEALLKNTNLYSLIQLLNEPDRFKKTLEDIDYQLNALENTKSVLKKLNRNMYNVHCRKVKERLDSFVPPEKAIVVSDVTSSEFAKMVNILTKATKDSVPNCAKIIYDIVTRLTYLKGYQDNQDMADEDTNNSINLLREFDIDLSKDSFQLFTDLNSRWGNFNSANRISIAQAIGGINKYQFLTLISNWADVCQSITLGNVVESTYSLKETTDAMKRYFAELGNKY